LRSQGQPEKPQPSGEAANPVHLLPADIDPAEPGVAGMGAAARTTTAANPDAGKPAAIRLPTSSNRRWTA